MTASPQTRNYLYGKGELFFRAVGSEGYDHLGNAPAFTISLTEEKLEHFSSMSGTKTKDLQLVTQKGAAVAFTLEEFTTGNILRAFKGAAVAKQMQAAATVSGQSVSANKGLYTFVGKEKLGFTRLEHGTVAGGTFAPGSSVVGSTSSATATVAYVTDGVLECVNVRGDVRARLLRGAGDFCARRGDRRLCNQSHATGDRPRRRCGAHGQGQRADRPLPSGGRLRSQRPHRIAARPRILLRRHGVPDRRLRVFRRAAC